MKTNYLKKKILFRFFAVCGFLAVALSTQAVSYGPNLVLNPGFEDDFTSWGGAAAKAIETVHVISGTKTAQLTGELGSNINQAVNDLVAGATYRFTFTGRILDEAGPSGGVSTERNLRAEIADKRIVGGGDHVVLLNLSITEGTDITVSGEFVVPEGNTGVWFRIIKTSGIAYIDDVAIQLKDDVSTSTINKNENNSSLIAVSNNDNSVTVCCEEPLKQLRLINIFGQTVYATNNFTSGIRIPVDLSARGIFIVEGITENDTKVITKFIHK
jgi:hypothetical protein